MDIGHISELWDQFQAGAFGAQKLLKSWTKDHQFNNNLSFCCCCVDLF